MPKTAKKPVKSKLVKKLDVVFSQWVRLSNADHRGFCECITCSKKFFWKEIQAGHFMSRRHYSTRWDEENVKPQCKACNIYGQGKQYEFSLAIGEKSADLLEKSRGIVKYTTSDIQAMIEHYQNELKEFQQKFG
tara:strand:+ start:1851 stop:2252 length:402 start_codon:yes stop_codon:yes gene_type:complete